MFVGNLYIFFGEESVIQSEVSQKEKKQIPYANTYIWNLREKKKKVMKNLRARWE